MSDGLPPAEAQQDDERDAVDRIAQQYRDPTLARFAINDFRDWLAARPSADTETLRALAADFDTNGNARPLGDPATEAWHKAAGLLRAALDDLASTDTAAQALARVEAEIADWPAADFWHRDAIRTAIRGEQHQ